MEQKGKHMKMSRSILFKRSFWLGRLIWMSGPRPQRNERLASLLAGCGVSRSEISYQSAFQFIDMCARGFSTEWRDRFEVITVGEFESLNGIEASAFLKAIETFMSLQVGHNIQLILVSSGSVSPDLKMFRPLSPIQIVLEDDSEDPGEASARVYRLIAYASTLAGVRIRRISKRAEIFLQQFLLEEGEDDSFVLILSYLMRTNTHELTLKNLMQDSELNRVDEVSL